jgi:hypothetical protein
MLHGMGWDGIGWDGTALITITITLTFTLTFTSTIAVTITVTITIVDTIIALNPTTTAITTSPLLFSSLLHSHPKYLSN